MERAERRSWSRVEPWAAALALAGCALRLGRGLGPAPFYNSDCAAPILVMQGMEKGAFTLFYPRQDRFGMWPFLLGRALHLQTPEAYHSLSVLGLCSAAIPLAGVLGNPALAVLTLMVPFVVSRSVAWHFLQAGQPYLWQVVAMCWAWWGCRVALTGRTDRSRWLALAGFAVASSLATWMNTASLAALLSVGVLEAFRARARPGRVAGMLAGLGAAGAFDAGLRRRYAVECLERFGRTFVTPLRIDRGHVLANLGPVLASLRHEGGLWPFLVGAAAIAAPRRTRAERLDGLALLLFGLSVLPGLVLVRYFRDNQFAGRYLSLPTFWALAAAVHGLLLVACALAGRLRQVVLALGLLALVVMVPPSPPGSARRGTCRRGPPRRRGAGGAPGRLPRRLRTGVARAAGRAGAGRRGGESRPVPGDRGRAPPGHDGPRALRARPAGWDAGAARRAPASPGGSADSRAPRSVVPACGGAGRGAGAGSLAEDDVGLLVHPHADVPAPQLAELDEEAVGERAHSPGVEEPLRRVEARRIPPGAGRRS